MTRREVLIPSGAAAALLAALVLHALWSRPEPVTGAHPAGRAPRIRPDYADVVIPPNIAPLNFTVLEPGRRHYVRISGGRGKAIDIHCDSAGIVIPLKPWRRLLQANRGQAIRLDVHIQTHTGQWRRFEPIRQTVAREEIDPYLVYRLIRPLYNVYVNVAIHQRNLETYDESPVVDGRLFGNGCVNCHTFLNHRTRKMLVHVRGSAGVAMLLGSNGRITRVDTRTKYNRSPAAYGCWHPSGKLLTFSANRLTLFMHAVGETRDVFDYTSDLGCYVLAEKAVKSSRHITRPERLETFPTWSPDGKWLYFSSAPKTPIERYRQVKYDLMRISYDSRADTWGQPETVLSARETNRSITEPRISPDGRFVMFCMAEYGNFPVYQPSSDLYLMDLRTRSYRKLAVNSGRCESWHCWSSSGRWFVFSSKRRDGVFAKPYFSYFDASGKAHKPFVLPQRDGDFYESFLKTYNVPELVTGPVAPGPGDFARAVLATEGALTAHAISGATQGPPKPGD
jgi:hypothetical protein